MTRSISLIAAGIGVGLAGFAAAAEAQSITKGAVDQLCAPRAAWTRPAAESCVGASYRLGVEEGLWHSNPAGAAR
jgi:hypothetical protein